MTRVLVLVPPRPGSPPPPEERPIGRAALALRQEGIELVFGHETHGGRASGWAARPGRWERVEQQSLCAAHDRLSGPEWQDLRRAALSGLAGVPVANSRGLKELCRDKLACQRHLERAGLELPAVEGRHGHFRQCLERWGAAYLKPRHGSRGERVLLLRAGDDLVLGDEAWVLQRAIEPAQGAPRVALRLLAQRLPARSWMLHEAVARSSLDDPIVGVERGAEAAAASTTCSEGALDVLEARAQRACAAIVSSPSGEDAVELGLDFVLDGEGMPHLIEVNSVPRGRLRALAELDPERWSGRHVLACAQPLRTLAAWHG